MTEFLLRLVICLASSLVLVAVGGAVEPVWRAFVVRLSGRVVLMLWGAAVAGMTAAWRMPEGGDGVALLRIALFVAPPVLAFAATLTWLRRRAGRHHPRPGRGESAPAG